MVGKVCLFQIYREDGCGLASNTTVRKLCKWHKRSQREVDWVTGGIIKITMEIRKLSHEKKGKVNDEIIVLGDNSSPYLDVDLFFNKKEKFRTRVHFKGGYDIKYVKVAACILTTNAPEQQNGAGLLGGKQHSLNSVQYWMLEKGI